MVACLKVKRRRVGHSADEASSFDIKSKVKCMIPRDSLSGGAVGIIGFCDYCFVIFHYPTEPFTILNTKFKIRRSTFLNNAKFVDRQIFEALQNWSSQYLFSLGPVLVRPQGEFF